MKKTLFIVFTIMAFTNLYASSDIESLLELAKLNNDKIKDMEADIKVLSMGDDIVNNLKSDNNIDQSLLDSFSLNDTQNMKMYLKKPDKIRMDITSPDEVTIIRKDNLIYFNMKSKKIQNVRKDRNLNTDYNAFDYSSLNDKYELKQQGIEKIDGKDVLKIYAQPKDINKLPTSYMYFDVETGLLLKISISTGNFNFSETIISYTQINGIYTISRIKTTIDTGTGKMVKIMIYSNIKINQGLRDKLFEFEF